MKVYVFTASILFISIQVWGQDQMLKGIVQDGITEKILPYANVSLWKKDSTVFQGLLSDSLGQFSFKNIPANISFVKVQALGYRSYNASILGKNSFLTIKLKPENTVLNEVFVQGERSVSDLQIDKQIFNTRQFQNSANGTGLDLIQRLPSVTVNTEGNVTLRGSSGFILLVDGKPSSRNPADVLAQIPSNLIESVEVLTTPSARYDADGKAGMINIITKKDSQIGTSWSGNMMNAGTNPLRWGGDIMWTLAEKKWNIFAAADYRRFDIEGFRVGEIRTILKDSLTYMPSAGVRDYRDFQYSLRAGGSFYPKSTDVFNWSAYVGEKQTDRMANLNYQEYVQTGIPLSLFSNSFKTPIKEFYNQNLFVRSGKFQTFTGDYSHIYANKSKLSLLALYEFSELGGPLNNSDTYKGTSQLLLWERSTETSPLTALRFQIDYLLPLSNNRKLEIGYHIRQIQHDGDFLFERLNLSNQQWKSDPNFSDQMKLSQKIHAPYVQLNGTKNIFTYALGLRTEYLSRTLTHHAEPNKIYSLDQIYLFPSFQGQWKLSDSYSFRTAYSRRIDRPTTKLMSPFKNHRHAETIENGDPNLLPEIADIVEIGISKSYENISFTATAYVNFLKDKVFRVNEIYSRTILGRTYTNAGNSQSTGMEFTTEIKATKNWKIYLSGNLYQFDVQGKFNGIETTQNSFNYNLNGNTVIDILPRLRFAWDINYLSKSVTTQGIDSELLLSNASLKYTLWQNKGSITFQAQNIFNTNVQTIQTQTKDFFSSTDYRKWDRVFQISLGFRINDRGQKVKSTKTDYGEKDF
ncbi:MAG: TonB-dependent receptor [Cytophagales bacterium]|nr:TonB-dependent receptor [Cytophagales bacterium]